MTFKATMAAWEYARLQGSVAPKSVRWAAPCAIFAVIVHKTLHDWTDWGSNLEPPLSSDSTMWTLFSSILGFLVVFRAQLSYARYWEGITLIERACAVWMNGVSHLFAFCSADPAKADAVDEFQYLASRLMSLLVSKAMHEVSRREGFPHLDLDGIEEECLEYLDTTSGKAIVVLQWLQRLVVEKKRAGVIDVEPPILSRVFQELSTGIVHFVDARKLTDVPFPFQFAQMVVIMLVFFSTLPIPLICAMGVKSSAKAAIYTFLIVFVFWSVHYIAVEIEHPFGEDANDLPLEVLNRRFNKVLLRLLEGRAQKVPQLAKKHALATGGSGLRSRPSHWSAGAMPMNPTILVTPKRSKLALFGGGWKKSQPGAHLAGRLYGASEMPADCGDSDAGDASPDVRLDTASPRSLATPKSATTPRSPASPSAANSGAPRRSALKTPQNSAASKDSPAPSASPQGSPQSSPQGSPQDSRQGSPQPGAGGPGDAAPQTAAGGGGPPDAEARSAGGQPDGGASAPQSPRTGRSVRVA